MLGIEESRNLKEAGHQQEQLEIFRLSQDEYEFIEVAEYVALKSSIKSGYSLAFRLPKSFNLSLNDSNSHKLY
jgi:hypothetical protein